MVHDSPQVIRVYRQNQHEYLIDEEPLISVTLPRRKSIIVSNFSDFLTDGGCGGMGVGFGLSGNVTFHFKSGKFSCISHGNANAHNPL
jgi:hypothetical protein